MEDVLDIQKIFKKPSLSRKEANDSIKKLIKSFLEFFMKKEYTMHESVKISSGIDPTIHFIGSHISVFKKYLKGGDIPQKGYVISQECIRTQNLKNYLKKDSYFNWASFFSSMGLISPPERLTDVCKEMLIYLREILKIPEKDIHIRISSKDKDLLQSCIDSGMGNILEIDAKPKNYYRHKFGFSDIFGRNFNIALRHSKTKKFEDIGNIILIERNGHPIAVELALGTSTVIKQLAGLGHVLDCFYITNLKNINEKTRRKVEDIILVVSTLYHEGLRHSNRGKGRVLGGYLKSLSYLRKRTNLNFEALKKSIEGFMNQQYKSYDIEVINEIIEYLKWFEKKTSLYEQFIKKIKKDS